MPACFPSGSITGARNKRAMEIIRSHVRGGIRLALQNVVQDFSP